MDDKIALIPIEQQQLVNRVSQQIALTDRLLNLYNDDLPELIPYRKGDKWGFCDYQKNIVIDCIYSSVRPFKNGLALVYLEKIGFINRNGEYVTPLIYNRANDFSISHCAEVCIGNKWGIINKKGREFIPCIYNQYEVQSFKTSIAGLLGIKKNQYCGIFDENGKEIIPYIYNSIKEFSEGFAVVEINRKYGFINSECKLIISCKYDYAENFSEGIARVEKDEKFGFI